MVILSGFSWDACLKMTKVRLELIKDVEMYTFFEQAIRGGYYCFILLSYIFISFKYSIH